jgi:hypothetical protein
VPTEIPAFAMTTSGRPWRAMKSSAAARSAGASATSAAYVAHATPSARASSSSGSLRRATRPSVAPSRA